MNRNRNIAFSAEYDAWGKRTVKRNTLGLRRGYCQHEHWNEFDLIDMNFAIEREQCEYGEAYSAMPSVSKMGEANGRMYDPVIGRFLSPDPYVQNATNPQNFNRYSYCLNNPLKYTDPSGNLVTDYDAGANNIQHGDQVVKDRQLKRELYEQDRSLYYTLRMCGCSSSYGYGSGYSRRPMNDSQYGEWSAISISDPAAIEYFISSGLYSADMATISGWASTMARMGRGYSSSVSSFLLDDTILLDEVPIYGHSKAARDRAAKNISQQVQRHYNSYCDDKPTIRPAVCFAVGNGFSVCAELETRMPTTARYGTRKMSAATITRESAKSMTKISNGLKFAGKLCLLVAVAADISYTIDAYTNNRPDQARRYIKATLDVAFGVWGVCGGPVGWGASGTYFLVDMCGGVDYILGIKEDY